MMIPLPIFKAMNRLKISVQSNKQTKKHSHSKEDPAVSNRGGGAGGGGGYCRSSKKLALEDQSANTREVAGGGAWGELLEVPAEIDLLETHVCDASSTANHEHRPSRPCTVCDQVPKLRVGKADVQSVHAHGSGDEGDVVDDCRCCADDGCEKSIGTDECRQKLRERLEHPRLLHSTDSHQNAHEEEASRSVDALEGLWHLELGRILPVEAVSNGPEGSKGE
mmetsp:Transcript_29214/g.71648  ORF Transcript_29214/g.71648 Transcript_29214/m.71648 type:complete len:222 (-) Transcript_29214:66-731(-)